jgi:hypothetical protein
MFFSLFGFWGIAYWIAYWSHWIAYWIACLSCFCFYHLSVAISGQAAQAAQPFSGSEINNSLVTMSSKQLKLQLVGVRTPLKRPSGSAGLPKPRIVPRKNKETLTVKKITMSMEAGCNTLDVKTLTGETITLKIVEDCINLETILVKTMAGETITLDVKASDMEGGTKDILIAQLNILIEELNKILYKDVYYVSLTSLMVTIGKVKAIHNHLAHHSFGPFVNMWI